MMKHNWNQLQKDAYDILSKLSVYMDDYTEYVDELVSDKLVGYGTDTFTIEGAGEIPENYAVLLTCYGDAINVVANLYLNEKMSKASISVGYCTGSPIILAVAEFGSMENIHVAYIDAESLLNHTVQFQNVQENTKEGIITKIHLFVIKSDRSDNYAVIRHTGLNYKLIHDIR